MFIMTQQDDTKKQESNKGTDESSKKDLKKNPGTKTMDQVEKPDKGDNIANPNAAQGSSSDGDTAS